MQAAFIRGIAADPDEKFTLTRETLTQDTLATAMATRNFSGFVIAQVEYIAEAGPLNPREVKEPGILVNCIVVTRA